MSELGTDRRAADLRLDARLDLRAAGPLRETLLAITDRDATVDAGAVIQLGTPCLQVLLAAASDWRRNGRCFRVTPMSEEFVSALRSFGVNPRDLVASEAAAT